MITKFKSADQYDPDHTRDCETTLVVLLRAFATLKSTLRLIGGLVPRYLTPASPPDIPVHAGTTDVDVVLDVSVLAERGTYDKLKRQLKDAGFTQYVPEAGKVSTWQWEYTGTGKRIVVEFLQHTDDPDPVPRLAPIDGEDVSACKILHAGIAHQWFKETEIIVDLPGREGKARETIRYADEIAFIVLKAIAFDSRHENKDAGDLIHVLRHSGSLDALAHSCSERLLAGQHVLALEDGLNALARRFCDDEEIAGYEKDGPSKYANFIGLALAEDEDRVREMRDVSEMVTYFIREVEKKTGRTFLWAPPDAQSDTTTS